MNIGIELLAANVGMGFENIITLVFGLGSFIFYAINFKTGAVLQMIVFAGLFIWFYEVGWQYQKLLMIFFIGFIFMCLSLYAVAKRQHVRSGLI
jgi:hypothetical protein